jgi:hypothetical protein
MGRICGGRARSATGFKVETRAQRQRYDTSPHEPILFAGELCCHCWWAPAGELGLRQSETVDRRVDPTIGHFWNTRRLFEGRARRLFSSPRRRRPVAGPGEEIATRTRGFGLRQIRKRRIPPSPSAAVDGEGAAAGNRLCAHANVLRNLCGERSGPAALRGGREGRPTGRQRRMDAAIDRRGGACAGNSLPRDRDLRSTIHRVNRVALRPAAWVLASEQNHDSRALNSIAQGGDFLRKSLLCGRGSGYTIRDSAAALQGEDRKQRGRKRGTADADPCSLPCYFPGNYPASIGCRAGALH